MQTQAKAEETQPKPKEQSTLQRTTLAKWGPRLPIGTHDPATGKLEKSIAHGTWDLGVEKRLGKLRDEAKNQSPARFPAVVVTYLYSQLGGLKLGNYDNGAKSSFEKDLLGVTQVFMGDVLYAYVWLRREVLGKDVPMELTCPRCRYTCPFTADLDTLDVRAVDRLEDIYWEYTLKNPFPIRGKPAEAFVLGPPKWSDLEIAGSVGMLDTGGTKSALIAGAIDHVVGQENIALAEHELDKMSKWDMENLSHLIDQHHLGPDMAIESSCPRCRSGFRLSIEWMYDSFFGLSGLSAP